MKSRRLESTLSVALIISVTIFPIFACWLPDVAAAPPQAYNFRDDFSYTSINSMLIANWFKCSVTPDSYYAVSGGILSLQNDGYAGAAICHNTLPQGVTTWNVTEKLAWTGQNPDVPQTGTIHVAVWTTSHTYTWSANGYYHFYALYKDGLGIVSQFGPYQPDHNWHIMTITMRNGNLSLYSDGSLLGTYVEDPASSNELLGVNVQAAWQSNANFDYVTVNGTPAPPRPDFSITSSPATSSVGFGQNATFTVTLTSLNNFAGTVQLSSNIAPQGIQTAALSLSPWTVSLNPSASATSTLLVQTYLLPRTGSFAFNVNATGSSMGHHVTIQLTVASQPSGWDFAVSVNPEIIPVVQVGPGAPAHGNTTATLTSMGGFTSNVALTAQFNATPLVNCTFQPSTVYLSPGHSPTSILSINFPAGWTWIGNWMVTITGSSGGLVHSVQATVTVLHSSVVVTLSRQSLVLKPGTNGSTTVTLQNNSTLTTRLNYNANIDSGSYYSPILSWTPAVNSVILGPGQSYSATLQVQVPSYTPTQQFTIHLEVFADTGWYSNQTIPLYVTLRDFTTGIEVGTWATYDFSVSTYPITLTARATVVAIDGTRVTYRADLSAGGIPVNSTIAWIDIATGEQSPGSIIPSLLIASSLTPGDSPYLQPPLIPLQQGSLKIAGTQRVVMSVYFSIYTTSLRISWDRSTGLLATVQATTTINYVPETVHYTLTDTSAWTGLSSGLVITSVNGQPFTWDFEATASGGEGTYSYNWDFGDGTTSALQNPSHIYTNAGNYTVTLTVTDSAGNTDTRTRTVNAQGPKTSQTSQTTQVIFSRLFSIPLNPTTISIIACWIIAALAASLVVIRADRRKRETMVTV